ncbi:MAG: element excision factor XisH family protein, partial [Bacteroidota bacterium]
MAKDLFHKHVREALEKDGWIITHDPYKIRLEGVAFDIDYGAEKLIAAS